MARKLKDIIADFERNGFVQESGKGSHRNLRHPKLPGKATLSGRTGADAQHYQEKMLRDWLRMLNDV